MSLEVIFMMSVSRNVQPTAYIWHVVNNIVWYLDVFFCFVFFQSPTGGPDVYNN